MPRSDVNGTRNDMSVQMTGLLRSFVIARDSRTLVNPVAILGAILCHCERNEMKRGNLNSIEIALPAGRQVRRLHSSQ